MKMENAMFRDILNDWAVSSYNEDTKEQIDYYIDESKCNVGDKAYMYRHEDDELSRLEILRIVSRRNAPDLYDAMIKNNDMLIAGELAWNADTSAEFITDTDCYLMWFKELYIVG